MNPPAFQFYPKEWLSDPTVSLMTLAQEGAYVRLLSYAWQDENCGIPDDPDKIARLLKISREEYDRGGYNFVLSKFKSHPTIQGVLVSSLLINEREKQKLWRSKSSIGGKNGAAKRWASKGQEENGGGHKMVKQPSSKKDNQTMALQFAVCSLHSTSTINSTSITHPSAADIYAEYPRKVGKPKALTAISKAMEKICPNCLLDLVKKYATLRAGEDPQFTPHPSTWFNQERYNDDPSTWKADEHHAATGQPSVNRNAGTYNENYDIAAALAKVR